jgi:hypothetical protein
MFFEPLCQIFRLTNVERRFIHLALENEDVMELGHNPIMPPPFGSSMRYKSKARLR